MKKNLFILLLTLPTISFAYLDPGSGSMLFYFIIGIFASLIYSIKNIYLTVKHKINYFFSKDKINIKDKKNIVFYSEGGKYWHSFKSVIENLVAMGIECSYYTSDKNDEGLRFKNQNFDSLFIGDGRFSLMSLNYLKAKILIMTTPQLDVLQLKRSKNVGYFIHLVHAPTDIFKYKPFAFDFFDCVMCSGQHQIDNIRLIEIIRKTKNKLLLKTGLVYFDELLKDKSSTKTDNKQKTVLLAPTWGVHSLLNKLGFKVIQDLTDANFKVILRFHPQSYINDTKLTEQIIEKCKHNKSIIIDDNPNGDKSMQQADILVSDISGIIFDFAFVYEKPIIAFSNSLEKNQSTELAKINSYKKTNHQIWELNILPKIATLIDIKDTTKFIEKLNKVLANDNKLIIQTIKELRQQAIFNYGNAGEVAAGQIKQLL